MKQIIEIAKIKELQDYLYVKNNINFYNFNNISEEDLDIISMDTEQISKIDNKFKKYCIAIQKSILYKMKNQKRNDSIDIRILFLIMAIDPNLLIFKRYYKTSHKNPQDIKEFKQFSKELIGVNDPYLLKYERKLYEKLKFLDQKGENIFDLKKLIIQYNPKNSGLQNITSEEFNYISNLAALNDNPDHNLNTSINFISNIDFLDNNIKKLLFLILNGDKDFEILNIYESSSNFREIFKTIRKKYKLSDYEIKLLISLEKEIHQLFFPDLKVSIWSI